MKFFSLLSLLFFISVNTYANEYVVNWAISSDLDYFKAASVDFKKRVEEKSKGRIKIVVTDVEEFYSNNLEDVQKDKFQMGQELVFNLEKINKEFSIWSLPFLFKTDEHIENYINSQKAKDILKSFGRTSNVRAIDYTFSGGFVFIHGEKINGFSELTSKKLKLEVCSDSYKDFLTEKLKAEMLHLDSEVSSPNSEIIAAVGDELFDVSRKKKVNVNITNHRVISRVLFISETFLNGLPDDLKNILLEEASIMTKNERAISVKGKVDFLAKAKGQGLVLNTWSDKQKEEAKKFFLPTYERFKMSLGNDPINHIESLPTK